MTVTELLAALPWCLSEIGDPLTLQSEKLRTKRVAAAGEGVAPGVPAADTSTLPVVPLAAGPKPIVKTDPSGRAIVALDGFGPSTTVALAGGVPVGTGTADVPPLPPPQLAIAQPATKVKIGASLSRDLSTTNTTPFLPGNAPLAYGVELPSSFLLKNAGMFGY